MILKKDGGRIMSSSRLGENQRTIYLIFLVALVLVVEAGAAFYMWSVAPIVKGTLSVTLAGISVVVGLLCLYLIGRKVTSSLTLMERCFQLLAEGDPVGVDRYIKSGQGLDSSREMVTRVLDAFFRLIGNMQRSSEELNYLVNLLKKEVETNRAGITEVSQVMNDIAGAADEEAGVMQRLAESIEALTNLARDIRLIAQEGVKLSREAGHLQDRSEEILHLLLTDIKKTAASNEESAGKVYELAEHIEQVNRFVEILTDIAEQTNFLALNAAIEATRAGDAGRGFAVVAEEVRKLAAESTSASQEIICIARDIKERAKQAAGEVKESANLVKGNLERGQEAIASMGQVVHAFTRVVQALEAISNKVDEQTSKLEVINLEASKVATAAEQAAASVEEITATVTQQSTATRYMEENIDRLVDMATRFQVLAHQHTKEGWDAGTRERHVREALSVLQSLAENPDLKSLNNDRVAFAFNNAFKGLPFLKTPLLVGVDGRVIFSNFEVDGNINWAFRSWFQGALKQDYFIGEPYITLNTNRLAITISCPVKNEAGEVIAVLAANIDEGSLKDGS